MLGDFAPLTKPGLFITATDTGVGKTIITCAIAAALRRQLSGAAVSYPPRVGVCKPFATDCRKEREGLVSADAEALAHFADCRAPLETINPIRYSPPLAPAAAANLAGAQPDYPALVRALQSLDSANDCLLIEGVGGLMAPLDNQHTVLDLATALGYPVLIVTRAGLGTLNHTAMTVRLLQQAACKVAGMVVNMYDADAAGSDPSVTSNRQWLEKMNRTPILATVAKVADGLVAAEQGRIPASILDTVAATYWPGVLASACCSSAASPGPS